LVDLVVGEWRLSPLVGFSRPDDQQRDVVVALPERQ
jgi:hypothetical protein